MGMEFLAGGGGRALKECAFLAQLAIVEKLARRLQRNLRALFAQREDGEEVAPPAQAQKAHVTATERATKEHTELDNVSVIEASKELHALVGVLGLREFRAMAEEHAMLKEYASAKRGGQEATATHCARALTTSSRTAFRATVSGPVTLLTDRALVSTATAERTVPLSVQERCCLAPIKALAPFLGTVAATLTSSWDTGAVRRVTDAPKDTLEPAAEPRAFMERAMQLLQSAFAISFGLGRRATILALE